MPRLADLIFADKINPTESWLTASRGTREWLGQYVRGYFAGATIIIADNIAAYWKEHSNGLKRLDFKKEFSDLLLPFDRAWIEYENPTKRGNGDLEPGRVFEISSFKTVGAIVHDLGDTYEIADSPHCIGVTLFGRTESEGRTIGPLAAVRIYTDSDGLVQDVKWVSYLTPSEAPENAPDSQLAALSLLLAPIVLAISFMNFKNVSIEQGQHSENITQSSWWKYKHKRPLCKHYILNINPLKKVMSSEGNVESNGIARAMHICRGHRATYTKERPLFGKFTGTFWIPAHVRGKAENGEIRKWYSVNAPQGQQ